ncbi:DUF998 domain-containing protein [Occultella glacieicola]|uniref:DUF998 domain-containing protein n=1 Tax=Occultella glacieicola TaxID=2518684 RepID=A0ABY2E443_9MICO|nr:DUF998 domain-containing protein [Occultella glacieicola]TDE94804.1 DUF998 domain-containing protein [Occultella glacieicola]
MTYVRRELGSMRRTLGALAYLAGMLYPVVEIVVALAWAGGYSWSTNFISDLGLTQCADLTRGSVCSPWHLLFNTALVLMGVLIALGSIALAPVLSPRWRGPVLAVALVHAAGVAMVGLFPGSIVEAIGGDTRRMLWHSVGTLAAIGGGLLLMLLAAVATRHIWRGYALASAVLACPGLLGIAIDTLNIATVGPGTVQRLTVYAVIVWLMLTGLSVLTGRPPLPSATAAARSGSA